MVRSRNDARYDGRAEGSGDGQRSVGDSDDSGDLQIKVTRAKRRLPTFNKYDLPPRESMVFFGSSTLASSTSTPPCATRRCASLFVGANPAATMIFVRNCGSFDAGRLFSSMSVGA